MANYFSQNPNDVSGQYDPRKRRVADRRMVALMPQQDSSRALMSQPPTQAPASTPPATAPSPYLSEFDQRPAGSLPPNHQGIQTSQFGYYGPGGWHPVDSVPNQNAGLPMYSGVVPPWLRTTDHPIPEPGVWNTQTMQEWLQGPGNMGPRRSTPQPVFGGPDKTTPPPAGYQEYANALRNNAQQFSNYFDGLVGTGGISEAQQQQLQNFEGQQSLPAPSQEVQDYYASQTRRSDRRLKTRVVRVGTHHLGIGVYDYDIDGRRERGVMAQEVLPVLPEAVTIGDDGFLRVNYGML